MSKLSTSLRDSISAEKQSIAQKPKIRQKSNKPTVYDLCTEHEESVHVKDATQNLTEDEHELFAGLKLKLLGKNIPTLHRYEMMAMLYELNLVNKNADYITNSTHRLLDGFNGFMQVAMDNLDEVSRNNLDAIRAMFEQTTQALNSFTRMRYVPFWLQLSASTKSI